jgi:hypothetical protein
MRILTNLPSPLTIKLGPKTAAVQKPGNAAAAQLKKLDPDRDLSDDEFDLLAPTSARIYSLLFAACVVHSNP